jgi:hypothetical protein
MGFIMKNLMTAMVIVMTTMIPAGCDRYDTDLSYSVTTMGTETSQTEVEETSLPQTISETTSGEIISEAKTAIEINTIPPPEDGWTLELFNQVVYINEKPVSFRATLGELKELFDGDYEIEDFRSERGNYSEMTCRASIYSNRHKIGNIAIDSLGIDEINDDTYIDYITFNSIKNSFIINGLKLGDGYDDMISKLGIYDVGGQRFSGFGTGSTYRVRYKYYFKDYLNSQLIIMIDDRNQIQSISMHIHDYERVDFVSLEYELDLDKLRDDKYYAEYYFSLRDELSFLDDEQFEVYISALILINGVEYSNIPQTNKGRPMFLWEGRDGSFSIHYESSLYDRGYARFAYVSSYSSFIDYLTTVFTDEAADEFIKKYRLRSGIFTIENEMYIGLGDKGGRQHGRINEEGYKPIGKNENEVNFEFFLSYVSDDEEHSLSFPISLINIDGEWRAEIFDCWI